MVARALIGSVLLATAATAAAQEESLCDPCVDPPAGPGTIQDIEERASRPQGVDTATTIEALIQLISRTETHIERVEAFRERMRSAEAEEVPEETVDESADEDAGAP